MEGGEGSPQKGRHCSALPVKSALPCGWLWRCGEVRGQRLSGLGAGADGAPPPKQGPGGLQEPRLLARSESPPPPPTSVGLPVPGTSASPWGAIWEAITALFNFFFFS